MKLGVICDGISRNLRHAVDVMDEFGLQYAELHQAWYSSTSAVLIPLGNYVTGLLSHLRNWVLRNYCTHVRPYK